jgi:hypothetical protein
MVNPEAQAKTQHRQSRMVNPEAQAKTQHRKLKR